MYIYIYINIDQPMIVNNPSQTLYSVISNGGLITLQPNNVISLLSHQHVMPQQSNSNTTNPVMIVGMDNLIKNISTNGVVKQQNVNTIIHSDGMIIIFDIFYSFHF